MCFDATTNRHQFGGQEKQLSLPKRSSVRVSVIQSLAGTQENDKIFVPNKITLVLEPPVFKAICYSSLNLHQEC